MWNLLRVWWHAVTLFIYFYINRAYIQYFIYTTRREPLLISSLLPLSTVEGLLWGAEQRFELGPAIQQADALLCEPSRTFAKFVDPRKTVLGRSCGIVAQEVPAFVMAGLGLVHLHLQSGATTTMLELAPFTLHYAYRQGWRRSGFESLTDS
jgi:hypothetical protein